ncbi:hypothetical protein CARUB_v10011787mg [Capsella rubella]|uniref:Protein kinase domain-containing protein n=1 Tax=Capsella rubella TaxID=81985 RepID=R0GLF0_9BRAS|nr:wall-associated receptor kinase 4 [Capsella rubella]EOA36591.1 hypothetical protein CARUB_v10011787mg [Capsella rubella]
MKMQEVVFLVTIFCVSYTELFKGETLPDCPKSCGTVTIEYPFGFSPGCWHSEDVSFKLTCKNETLFYKGLRVVNISHSSQLRILYPTSYTCYNSQQVVEKGVSYYTDQVGSLTLSDDNRLTAVGCDTFSFVSTGGTRRNSFGCISVCDDHPLQVEAHNECNGEGCCQTSVIAGSSWYIVRAYRFTNGTSFRRFSSPCVYAFLAENGTFKFNSMKDYSYLQNTSFPVVLDWSIGGETCRQVGNESLCSVNSICSNSTRTTGYVCKCEDGYFGNPYLEEGCKDINECISSRHNCLDPSTCENTNGSFTCNCPTGFRKNSTSSCTLKERHFEWTRIFLGTTIGFLLILLGLSCIQQRMKHQKDTKLRQQFFEQNGGTMLIQRLSGAGPSNVDVKIFTEEGMNEATNGYDESRILGQGGQGTVYKGILPDKSIVAIKRARLGDNSQVEQFINEVLVLSQINHRNVVKLLGCGLETEVPLLVYEFITSGTLFDHLHGSVFNSSLTWEHRLRIAIEIAGTLSYLHSSASIPIIHRDVKTANILLDENLTAKVADFGASRLVPMNKEQLTTMVQGTLGYLDPEYYNTGLLNEKSDVYSFGVVLMELLSGQKALCFERPQTSKHLVSYFATATKENKLHEIIDGQLMKEDNLREIQEAARVAVECTRLTGEERPGMKEVAAELEALRVTKTKHKWSDQYPEAEDIEHLLGVQTLSVQGETSSIGYDSIKNVAILDIEAGR